jgi:hypothetical protein
MMAKAAPLPMLARAAQRPPPEGVDAEDEGQRDGEPAGDDGQHVGDAGEQVLVRPAQLLRWFRLDRLRRLGPRLALDRGPLGEGRIDDAACFTAEPTEVW